MDCISSESRFSPAVSMLRPGWLWHGGTAPTCHSLLSLLNSSPQTRNGDDIVYGPCKAYQWGNVLDRKGQSSLLSHHVCCPLQLFKKPHPPKRVRSRLNGENAGLSVPPGATSDKIFFHHLDNLRPSLTPVKGKMMAPSSALKSLFSLLVGMLSWCVRLRS